MNVFHEKFYIKILRGRQLLLSHLSPLLHTVVAFAFLNHLGTANLTMRY